MKTDHSSLWAVLFSVGTHGVIGFGLWWLSSNGLRERNTAIEVDSCVVVDDAAGRMYLPSAPAPMRSRGSIGHQEPSEVEEEFAPFTATVRSAPARDELRTDPPMNDGSSAAIGKPALGSVDSGGARNPDAGDAVARYYGMSVTGRSVVLVIDRSLSMGLSGAFRQAKRETAGCLQHLPPDAKFQVILYNRHAEPLRVNGSTDLLSADPAIITEVEHRIGNLRAEGATDHLRALKEAIHLKPELIYMVTDADGLTLEAVDAATRINLGKTTIHCIEVASGSDDRGSSAFRRLAKANGGTYRLVDVNGKPDEGRTK